MTGVEFGNFLIPVFSILVLKLAVVSVLVFQFLVLSAFNHFYDILRLSDVLPKFPSTINKMMRDYYL